MILETGQNFKFETLDYLKYKKAFEDKSLEQLISNIYGKPLSEIRDLSADPDHGGQVTLSSLLETMTAFELEQNGILGLNVMRGPAHTDLKDGWERNWDVKTPPYIEGIGFNEEAAIHSVLKKFHEFPDGNVGILLDISFLHEENYLNLQKDLKTQLTDNQKFLVRQVIVKGVIK